MRPNYPPRRPQTTLGGLLCCLLIGFAWLIISGPFYRPRRRKNRPRLH
jgi:hypothetical protein